MACPVLHYFSTLYHKRHNFRKEKKLLNTKCLFWFSLQILSETSFILRRLSEIWSKMYVGLHVKCPLFFSNLIETWIFSTDFRKLSNIKFHENPSCESQGFPCGRTDRHDEINPLNPELNPICYLLALLGAHHFLHVSRIRVKLLTLRLLMSYIYGAPILDVSRSHTTTQHSR